jgi:hypothetical protein
MLSITPLHEYRPAVCGAPELPALDLLYSGDVISTM